MLKTSEEFNLAKVEEKVLQNWTKNQVFNKLQARKAKKIFKFYEGPPYANGHPGIHHILSRVFKDIILRYKSMSGYSVPRRAGWDTHGLPIEIQVEKELGIKSKKEIEKLGVSLFNKKAREIIWKYLDEWERFTDRIGYWLDLKNAYVTYTNDYIESLWWIFKEIHKRGYLKESRKIVPYCPRCETPLSSHEMGQPGVYQLAKDPSVYIKFKLRAKSSKTKNTYLLVWTTTPWTLPSNFAVAVDPQLTYTKYEIGDEYFWSYNPLPHSHEEAEVVEKISGKKMIGWEYEPLYKTLSKQAGKTTKDKAYKVVGADFVQTGEGTGLVHISPAFGEDDFALLGQVEFPVTIDNHGKVIEGLPGAGKFIKEADKDISADLVKRKLMYLETVIEHEYPFCWRCSTPLIYFAKVGWFFEVSRLRKKLMEENNKINWTPDYIKSGRMGEWLKEAKDWSISRDRYWGTPLPIWKCDDCEAHKVIGSFKELTDEAYHKNNFYIMRHGQAESNMKDVIAAGPEKGSHISKLTEKGKAEALAAAKLLKKKNINVIFSSPYKRTMDTAGIVAKEIKGSVIADKRLREADSGTFNWGKVKEHKKFFRDPIEEFTKAPPGGENLIQVKERVFDFVKDVNARYRGKNILIVGHGDPLWMLEAAVNNLSNEEALKLSYIGVGEARQISFKNLPYNEEGEVDIHRPYVDEVYLKCDECGGSMKRISDVADVWFDSGAMPLASVHYPFENRKFIDSGEGYPADYISEGIDQTRGWFYTLLTVAVLLGKPAAYKNVISLGLIRDKHGLKMSKSKGNVVNPWEMIDKYGVDAVRWYFYTVNPPAEPKNFDETELTKVTRQFFFTLYNSYVFYASADAGKAKAHIMDKWILARLNQTIETVTNNLNKYEIGGSAKAIAELVEDLSRWYIRRSRKRDGVKPVLGHVLTEISKLTAPFTPFFGDALYQSLGNSSSVHLAVWPKLNKKAIDKALIETMAEVRRLSTLALARRAELGIKVRQPLQSLKVKTANKKLKTYKDLLEVLKDEVNVKQIIFDDKLETEVEFDINITPALKEEGTLREFTRLVQDLRKKGGLMPKDKVSLFVDAEGANQSILQKNSKKFAKEVGAKTIAFRRSEKFNAEWIGQVNNSPVWLALKKI